MDLTPRQNMLGLYRRRGYETVPVYFRLCPALEEHFHRVTGSTQSPAQYFGFPMKGIPDLKPVPREVEWSRYFPEGLKPGTEVDQWGVAREPGSAAAMHMRHMRHPMAPLDSIEQFQAYPWPAFNESDADARARTVAEFHAQGFPVQGSMQCTIWETAWYMRSMEQLMMDMATEDEKALWLLDKVTDLACVRAAAFARAGVDLLELGDDVGMQSRMMMSPEFYRQWLKPRLARVIAAARAVKPDVLIFYHSCGYVRPVIQDFIEAGVDILNPVQPECMDFAEIHAEFGDRLSFNGTVGTQTTMPFGTPEEVRATVHRNLRIAGPSGGLLPCPTHMVEPEVPWANVEAYVAACRDFRP